MVFTMQREERSPVRNYRLGIIGTGQIGSRHLQALAMIDRPVSVQVVDIIPDALRNAKERFNEMKGSGNVKHVDYLEDISEMFPELDCVIVATTADRRRKAIETLLREKHVDYLILEKVLFQRRDDFRIIHTLLNQYDVKAWVNFSRRMWPIYRELETKTKNTDFVSLNVTGSQWGLGCNGLHYLDLFAFLTHCTEITILSDSLDSKILTAKRQGFVEFTGALHYLNSKKNHLSMTSYPTGNAPLLVQITSPTSAFVVDENNGIAWISEDADGWKWHKKPFSIPYQSQLTHLVVQKILDTGQCDLASYDDSWKIHIPFLEALSAHLRKINYSEGDICPIT